MKNIKLCLLILFLYIIYIMLSAYSYSSFVSDDISNNIVRLHIVANSNSAEDQYLKLKIRDEILEYFSHILDSKEKPYSKNEILEIASSHKEEISDIVNNTVLENGYNYTCSVNIEKIQFPSKTYGTISLPCGKYDAINIKLGKSKGENWWCIMYPDLCIDYEENSEILDVLDPESYYVISSEKKEYKIKFKILEMFNIY